MVLLSCLKLVSVLQRLPFDERLAFFAALLSFSSGSFPVSVVS